MAKDKASNNTATEKMTARDKAVKSKAFHKEVDRLWSELEAMMKERGEDVSSLEGTEKEIALFKAAMRNALQILNREELTKIMVKSHGTKSTLENLIGVLHDGDEKDKDGKHGDEANIEDKATCE